MTNIESIKSKIAALLAKAEGTDNVHEQDAFMAKVNELLERHQIEMHEIRKAGTDNDPMTDIKGEVTRSHEWPSRVGFALARYYGCKMRRWNQVGSKARYTWRVVGRESACVTFDLMYPFILSQVRQQARAFANEVGISLAKAERSVGVELEARLWRLVEVSDERRAANARNALVPVSDVDAYMNDRFGGPARQARAIKAAIYAGADDYANKVSLNHQATGAGRKQIA